jgi:hypothetical protein
MQSIATDMRWIFGGRAEVPEGLLEGGSYDLRNGKVRFTARLSLGSDYVGAGKQVASRDVYQFEGRLGGALLRGVLTHVDEAEAKQLPATTRVMMKRQRVRLGGYQSIEAWRRERTATPR